MNAEALTSKSCTPCRGGIPSLSSDQVKKCHRDTPEWTILDEDRRIERTLAPTRSVLSRPHRERALKLADPECNPLLPLWHHAARSHVPAAKSIPVRIRRHTNSRRSSQVGRRSVSRGSLRPAARPIASVTDDVNDLAVGDAEGSHVSLVHQHDRLEKA
jgi:hypothetical protein